MLNITTLRSPRTFAIAAAFALAAALPGAGLVQSAHAAPAITPTTFATTISGPVNSAAGAQGTYTVVTKNDPAGATADSPAVYFAIAKTDGSLLSYSAPGAFCHIQANPGYNVVRCDAPSLVVGGELDLTVNVMFSGKTGIDTILGAGDASNASIAIKTMQTTIVAQEQFPSQNPGFQAPYSGQGFGGSNA
jgi:hypothetical protein